MGFSSFAPKWTVLFLLFAPINLFFHVASPKKPSFEGSSNTNMSRVGSNRALVRGNRAPGGRDPLRAPRISAAVSPT
jgi:hypothetical protein